MTPRSRRRRSIFLTPLVCVVLAGAAACLAPGADVAYVQTPTDVVTDAQATLGISREHLLAERGIGSGNYTVSVPLLHLPGRGQDVSLAMTYNARVWPPGQWTPERANQWYAKMPWLVGCNFSPSTAINQLEMWQAETFDSATIDRELGWAEDLGFTSVRVFLHDLPWKKDYPGFPNRIHEFLKIAAKHRILLGT